MADSNSANGTPLPLALLVPGVRARVITIQGGFGFVRRMAEMGISPGSHLTALKGGTGGPVIVEGKGSRLVMGRGMAHKVLVETLS